MKSKVGRRGWLAGIIPNAVDAVVETRRALRPEPRLTPRRRPPGSTDEKTFLSLCDGCGDCVSACPHDAVFTYVPTADGIGGTPVMRPERTACVMCEGFPCASACPTGALMPVRTANWWLGEVQIDTTLCFTYQGPECGACARLCPNGLKGLRLRGGLRPYIDPAECVGCGLCIAACPTMPKAISLMTYRPDPIDPIDPIDGADPEPNWEGESNE